MGSRKIKRIVRPFVETKFKERKVWTHIIVNGVHVECGYKVLVRGSWGWMYFYNGEMRHAKMIRGGNYEIRLASV